MITEFMIQTWVAKEKDWIGDNYWSTDAIGTFKRLTQNREIWKRRKYRMILREIRVEVFQRVFDENNMPPKEDAK